MSFAVSSCLWNKHFIKVCMGNAVNRIKWDTANWSGCLLEQKTEKVQHHEISSTIPFKKSTGKWTKLVNHSHTASLGRFNTQYKHGATPTKPASDDIFSYYQTSSELETCNREKERNIQCNSISTEVLEASVITLDKSPVCSKVDEKKSKLQTVVTLIYC